MPAGKIAVIYGAAGPIGSAMARGSARNGARVHLTGRSDDTLRAVADSIPGGAATTHVVDALDPASVDDFVRSVIAAEGNIDISANVIGIGESLPDSMPAADRQRILDGLHKPTLLG